MVGKNNWEEAESELMKMAAQRVLMKAELKNTDIRYLIGGDLLGTINCNFFWHCRTWYTYFRCLWSMFNNGRGNVTWLYIRRRRLCKQGIAITSSHFAGAEKQFRFPLDYGNQRPYSASWTVTGSVQLLLADENKKKNEKEPDIVITRYHHW